MEEREKKEEKNKRIGWLVSVAVQLFMLVLFYFLIAWKAPFPPIPEYGIELGFSQSAGAAPPVQASQQEEVVEEEVSEEQTEVSEEVLEEVVKESTEESATSEAEQPVVEEIEPEIAVVEESDTPAEATVQEVVKEVETEVKEVPKETEPTSEAETEVEEVKQVTEETEGVEEVEKPNDSDSDEVVVEPSIDERAIYGSQGTSTGNQDGASLALAGWLWDFKPKPEDDSDETGKIVYKIVVDQDGYLVKIEPVTSTVSPAVERKYRQAVSKLTFSKTSDYKPASLSSGTLTFIIKSK